MPHQLSDDNKATQVTMAGILLRNAKNSGFFNSIVTSDEKWIRYDNATRKRQWLDAGEPLKPTPKSDLHGKKVMFCVWWNSKGLMYFEVLDLGQTVTADLYQDQLDRVDQALHRQGVNTANTKLLHDNAHCSMTTTCCENHFAENDELGWEVLPQPPYSPDLRLPFVSVNAALSNREKV